MESRISASEVFYISKQSIFLGIVSTASWLTLSQIVILSENIYSYTLAQTIATAIALLGAIISHKNIKWLIFSLLFIFIYVTGLLIDQTFFIWVALGLGLLARGGLSVVSRQKALRNIKEENLAIGSFFFGGFTKVFQSIILFLFSLTA